MKVTSPEMSTALLYLSATAVERNQRYMVVAIMLARAKERQLYTAWYCRSLIVYIVMAAKLVVSLSKLCQRMQRRLLEAAQLEPKCIQSVQLLKLNILCNLQEDQKHVLSYY